MTRSCPRTCERAAAAVGLYALEGDEVFSVEPGNKLLRFRFEYVHTCSCNGRRVGFSSVDTEALKSLRSRPRVMFLHECEAKPAQYFMIRICV